MLEELRLNHNQIAGKIPDDLGNLSRLNHLDLSRNDLDGSIPESIDKLRNLSVLNLSSNKLVGRIPQSIGNISSITSLDLSGNNLAGEIPISLINLHNLSSFDVSYNNLSGTVPPFLVRKFNSSSFAGNVELCGYGTLSCLSPEPENRPSSSLGKLKHHHLGLSTKDIILVAAGALLVVLLILCCLLLCCLIKKKGFLRGKNGRNRVVSRGRMAVGAVGCEVESSVGETEGKLAHFDGLSVFTADDLLCATAEIMGKSTYGTAYKATLEDNNQIAVKRLREKITKSRKEFEIEIAQLGKIRHPNILPLRGYYFGPKGEKLLVYDYMHNGSLASFLHARGPDTSAPWQTRLSIAIGTTRGLCYLHTRQNIIHGNLTSTNILLDEQNKPRISDIGLSHLMTNAGITDSIATAGTKGYRAPELLKLENASSKSDVYSLGVKILELLTGKSPSEAMDDGLNLAQWVASIVKEEWSSEVFDEELMKDASNIGDELLSALKLALHCVDTSPTVRPEAVEVLQKLEEIELDSTENTAPSSSVDEDAAAKDE